MSTAVVRSAALGTRIAAVTPSPFSIAPDTTAAIPYPDAWNLNQRDDAAITIPATRTSKKRSKERAPRPASAPLFRRSGKVRGGNEALRQGQDGTRHHRLQGAPESTRNARARTGGLEKTSTVHGTRARVAQGRPRPSSARPSSGLPASTPATSAAPACAISKRRVHRSRRLPPPWGDNSNAGGSSESGGKNGGASGGCRNAGRGKGHKADEFISRAEARAPKIAGALDLMRGDQMFWDTCGGLEFDLAAPVAVAGTARTATAPTASSEAAVAAATVAKSIPHGPAWPPPEKGFGSGGAVGAGRPYMSRAERAAEESKEMAKLRREVEFWKRQTHVARAEVVECRRRLETQEEGIAGILHQTAEVLPTYRYGINLDLASRGQSKSYHETPEIAVLEHRRELEKCLVVRRMRGQMSRLNERLNAAEGELERVKRSCQFTALTEMLAAGEEYANEVERLRSKLKGNQQQQPNAESFLKKNGDSGPPVLPRVLDIPSAPGLKSSSPRGKQSRGWGKSKVFVGPTAMDAVIDSPGDEFTDKENSYCLSLGGERSDRPQSPVEKIPYENKQQQSCQRNLSPHGQEHQEWQQQQQQQQRTEPQSRRQGRGKEGRSGSRNHRWGKGAKRQQQQQQQSSQHEGGAFVSSRARAGLLGILGPGDSRGYLKIDDPIVTASSAGRGGRGVQVPKAADECHGMDAKGASTIGQGGKIGLTTEMEIDVMKGLVLAQHHRIQRQRSRMQELERDLRDYRRAAVVGGKWPEAPWSKQLPSSPVWKVGLTPSRSSPAGLDRLNGKDVSSLAVKHYLGMGKGNNSSTSAIKKRPRTARAAGRRLIEASGDTVFRDGSRCSFSGTGAGKGKRRPRSASARFDTSSGRPRVHESSGQAGSGEAGQGGEESAREPSLGCDEANGEGLPEGWAQAVDEETGHVYYYSERRSTWIRPVEPASPRDPEDDISGSGVTSGKLARGIDGGGGGGGGDHETSNSTPNTVACPAGVCGFVDRPVEGKSATSSLRGKKEGGEKDVFDVGDLDGRDSRPEAAANTTAAATAASPSKIETNRQEILHAHAVAGDDQSATAGIERENQGVLEANKEGLPPPLDFEDGGTPSVPRFRSDSPLVLLSSTVSDTPAAREAAPAWQIEEEGGQSEVEQGDGSKEIEPSRLRTYHSSTGRSDKDLEEDEGEAKENSVEASIHRGKKAPGGHQPYAKTEGKVSDEEEAPGELVSRCPRPLNAPPAEEFSARAADPLSPVDVVATNFPTSLPDRYHKQVVAITSEPESQASRQNGGGDFGTAVLAPTDTSIGAAISEEVLATAIKIPAVEATTPSGPPSLSQEETMSAMAALIATLRSPPPPAETVGVSSFSEGELQMNIPNTSQGFAGVFEDGHRVEQGGGDRSRGGSECGAETAFAVEGETNVAPLDQTQIDRETGADMSVTDGEGGRQEIEFQGEPSETAGGIYEDDFEED